MWGNGQKLGELEREMNKHLANFRQLARHKYFVYLEGRKLGLSRIRMLIHDYQKYTPSEWTPYANKFHTGGTPRRKDGGYDPTSQGEAFSRAWNHHVHHGSHHWQHFINVKPDGSLEVLPMPDKDRRELLADWRGAGRTYGNPDTRAWYAKNKDQMILHPDTRAWVERKLAKGKVQHDELDRRE